MNLKWLLSIFRIGRYMEIRFIARTPSEINKEYNNKNIVLYRYHYTSI